MHPTRSAPWKKYIQTVYLLKRDKNEIIYLEIFLMYIHIMSISTVLQKQHIDMKRFFHFPLNPKSFKLIEYYFLRNVLYILFLGGKSTL